MSDHVIYTRPLVVTKERLRAAREKQEKQLALKEALNKQIEEMKGRKHSNVSEKKLTSLLDDPVEKCYKFSYEGGHGKFVLRDDAAGCVGGSTAMGMPLNSRGITADPISTQRPPYQSNSLPPNFSMNASEANPLVPKRPEYNTNSLPVNLVYNISKQNDLTNIVPPQTRESVPVAITSRGSPVLGGLTEENEYQRNILARNVNVEEVKSQIKPHHSQQPQSQRPPRSPGRGLALPSGRSQSPLLRSLQTSQRRGGPLPPLELHDGANGMQTSIRGPQENCCTGSPAREPPAVQPQNGGILRAVKQKHPLPPRGRSNDGRARGTPLASAPRNIQNRAVEKKVELLQKELESREMEMARLREKEKSWEEQVRQLKLELKSAKMKERDLHKLVQEGPQRAETAPDQAVFSQPPLNSLATGGRKVNGAPSGPTLGRKQDLARNCVFTHKNFRPISAPSDTVAIVKRQFAREALPPLQDSFKCASVLTRKTAFGLPEEHANRPVPIEYEHLLQFVNEHIITQEQADGLWRLFTNGRSPLTLLHRQSEAFSTPDDAVLDRSCKSEVIDVAFQELEHGFRGSERKMEEGDEEGEEEEENEEEMEYDNNGEVSPIFYSPEHDTFETFAELHLDEYLSQEEADEAETEEEVYKGRNGASQKRKQKNN